MTISRLNLTFLIVSFKSNKIISKCINSIDSKIKIIVIENSNDIKFKNYLEKKYKNVKCYLSKENLGMGSANNLGIKYSKTNYVFIINPDVILNINTLKEIYKASKFINDFSILSPILSNKNFPNFKKIKNQNISYDVNKPFNVESVDGFAMLLNKKKIKKALKTKDFKFFDEKIFLYLENDDLCKNLIKKNEKIYIIPKSKVRHMGGKSVDNKYYKEINYSRNWHWIWSKFYYNKKHFGFLFAFLNTFPTALSALIKTIFYTIMLNNYKRKIYFSRLMGFLYSVTNQSSSYRPKINI